MSDSRPVDPRTLVANISSVIDEKIADVPLGRRLHYFPEFAERRAKVNNLADYEEFMTWFDAEYAMWVRRMYRSRRAKKILKGQAGRLSGPLTADRREGFWQCAGMASNLYTRGLLRQPSFASRILPAEVQDGRQ